MMNEIKIRNLKIGLRYFFIFLILYPVISSCKQTRDSEFTTVTRFRTLEAVQGVAVNNDFFYTINSKGIGKYDKNTGRLISSFSDTTGRIIHLDGGMVLDDKLYCAHSNFPGIPMTSTIEIFSAVDLKHNGTHSFGILYGSCTWADFHNNFWWVCFANYDQFRKDINKGTENTVLVKFDRNWKEKDSWTFPSELISELKPMSASGGSWGPDGNLYVTGHDSAKVYLLQLPESGSVLELNGTMKIESHGQGIAWDRSNKNRLFGIIRKDNSVIVSELSYR
jgi:hypothetical protein